MTPTLFQKVERAFHDALAARDGTSAGSDAFDLFGVCHGDSDVMAEVKALVAHHDAAKVSARPSTERPAKPESDLGFLDPTELHPWRYAAGTARPLLAEWDASAIGQRVGDFTLIGELGTGGMGVVFVAEQDRPRRLVALKVIRRQLATPTMIRRFTQEADLLGRLNHSGIAQVFAAGVADLIADTGNGPVRVPYIAMELVEGESILAFVERLAAGRSEDVVARATVAAALVVKLCEAVQHAHARGVIHRDLKPANVLVTECDGRPQVKVLDFGVARSVQSDHQPDEGTLGFRSDAPDPAVDGGSRLTAHGRMIGTLSYMSPEQLHECAKIDARTDVYAIGAIFYQLLTGRPPIDVSDCTFADARRRIVSEMPSPFTTSGAILGLQKIVFKTLEKDPAQRCPSAAALRQDIDRYLNDHAVKK